MLWKIDCGYIAVIVIDCVLGAQLNFRSGFRVGRFWGFEKKLKNGVFWGSKWGAPAWRAFITLPFRRELAKFSRLQGFFLLGNRLAVVLCHEKNFFRGVPPDFWGFFSKILKNSKKNFYIFVFSTVIRFTRMGKMHASQLC